MAEPLATLEDLAARHELTPDQTAKAPALLRDASALLRARVADLDARLTAEPPQLDSDLVVAVICGMVLRVLRNPNGYQQENIEGYGYIRSTAAASGYLYVSPEDLLALGIDPDAPTRSAFTIQPYNSLTIGLQPDPWTVLPPGVEIP